MKLEQALVPVGTAFHTSFLPDLTQVSFNPDTFFVELTFVHDAPALIAAAVAGALGRIAIVITPIAI